MCQIRLVTAVRGLFLQLKGLFLQVKGLFLQLKGLFLQLKAPTLLGAMYHMYQFASLALDKREMATYNRTCLGTLSVFLP